MKTHYTLDKYIKKGRIADPFSIKILYSLSQIELRKMKNAIKSCKSRNKGYTTNMATIKVISDWYYRNGYHIAPRTKK